MSVSLKNGLRVAGAGLALAGAVSAPAFAQGHETATTDQTASMVVVRDAATGRLRAPTAAELAALKGQHGESLRVPLQTLPRVHAGGGRGVRLSDQFMSHSVVTRQADGSLSTICYDSRDEAEAAVKAAAAKNDDSRPTE